MTCRFCQDSIPSYLCPECSALESYIVRGECIGDSGDRSECIHRDKCHCEEKKQEIERWGAVFWWKQARYWMDKYAEKDVRGMQGLQRLGQCGTHDAEEIT